MKERQGLPLTVYALAAIVIGLMVMLVSASAAEPRDPRDGRGPFFDGDWTPVKVHHHASKNAQHRRGVERRPGRTRKDAVQR